MSSFDVAATVAIGSTLASTAVGSVSLSQGAAGLLVLFGQLRAAGVQQLHQVRAVVLETTGDLSVLTADRPRDADLLRGVGGADRL